MKTNIVTLVFIKLLPETDCFQCQSTRSRKTSYYITSLYNKNEKKVYLTRSDVF